jgi:hypothetical protein
MNVFHWKHDLQYYIQGILCDYTDGNIDEMELGFRLEDLLKPTQTGGSNAPLE